MSYSILDYRATSPPIAALVRPIPLALDAIEHHMA
jgi:hypothetical protein